MCVRCRLRLLPFAFATQENVAVGVYACACEMRACLCTGPDQWTLFDKDAACIPKNGCIQVCITDFGGQLVYQQTHPMLFAGRALYVVVYSCLTEVSWVDLQAHIQNVTSRTRESPILLVGTHHDKRSLSCTIPLPALKNKFPQVGVMHRADANGRSIEHALKGALRALVRACLDGQIVNTDVLELSSLTGENVDVFMEQVATIIMGMPFVRERVPASFVSLGHHLRTWAAQLVAADKPPVATVQEVTQHIRRLGHGAESVTALLDNTSDLMGALEYLCDIGAVAYPRRGGVDKAMGMLVLDPRWLSGMVSCMVTADPKQLAVLPPCLVKRGVLQHDPAALSRVWSDAKGYTAAMRAQLLPLLLKLGLAFRVHGAVDDANGLSVVPGMLPQDGRLGGVSLDVALGPVTPGLRESGFLMDSFDVSADFWPVFVYRCAPWAKSLECSRTRMVVEGAGQRAVITWNVDKHQLSVVTRGCEPEVLATRLYWAALELVQQKYPYLPLDKSLHALCHVCHCASQVYGRPLRAFQSGSTFVCSHCEDDDVVLEPMHLVQAPADRLPSLLADGRTSLTPVVRQVTAQVAACVDVTRVTQNFDGRRQALWVPLVPPEDLVAGCAGGVVRGWLPVCEDDEGWHLVERDPVQVDAVLSHGAWQSVVPMLLQVSRTLQFCASRGAPTTVDVGLIVHWLVQVQAGAIAVGEPVGLDWLTFSDQLVHACTVSDSVFPLTCCARGRWTCSGHLGSLGPHAHTDTDTELGPVASIPAVRWCAWCCCGHTAVVR